MDTTTQRLMAAAAGATGDLIGIEDVFNVYAYRGNNVNRSINTGVDMTSGGLCWFKIRDDGNSSNLFDTERGINSNLKSDSVGAASINNTASDFTSFNNNGFSLGPAGSSKTNWPNEDIVCWSFKKQKKFFDVVVWDGDGSSSNRQLSHELGSTPGMMIMKAYQHPSGVGNTDWQIYHRRLNNGVNPEQYAILFSQGGDGASSLWGNTAPTSTHFTIGSGQDRNGTGGKYVCYLFAHEEASFGPNSDQTITSCGSYSGNHSNKPVIDLGFEPQFILLKNVNLSTENWFMFDSKRGISTNGTDYVIEANRDVVEAGWDLIDLTPNGFKIKLNDDKVNNNGGRYIYYAIAAETGKTTKAIEDPTDVFAMDYGSGSTIIPAYDSGFPVDFGLEKRPASNINWWASSRLTQSFYSFPSSSSGQSASNDYAWDSNVGFIAANWADSTTLAYMFKRHAGLDVVTYIGNGNNTDGANPIKHNLGPDNVPEMIWIKARDGGTYNGASHWSIGHYKLNGGTNPWRSTLIFGTGAAAATSNYGNTAPTSSNFYVGNDSNGRTNNLNTNHIAILFSSVESVSKVDGYDGDANAQDKTISCGFQPRLVIAKCSTVGGSYNHWFVFDSTRGAGSGNDKALRLDSAEVQTTNQDIIEFTSNGFVVKAGYQLNEGSRSYIYYAHA